VSAAGRTFWGWHQLSQPWADRLVATAGIGPGDLVVDVGAGSGALTAPLLAAGARVVAVELHPDRCAVLAKRFAADDVVVVRADAADLRLPRQPFRVVANPPFAITTALLRRLLAAGSRLDDAHLVVPVHVARRWVAGQPKGAGRWHAVFDASIVATLPRTAFRPPPPMRAVVLKLRRR
jgi:23S rRNA (adenine-N6)-dimethyltransferase